jgi:hypothetical protein
VLSIDSDFASLAEKEQCLCLAKSGAFSGVPAAVILFRARGCLDAVICQSKFNHRNECLTRTTFIDRSIEGT